MEEPAGEAGKDKVKMTEVTAQPSFLIYGKGKSTAQQADWMHRKSRVRGRLGTV